MKCHAKTLRTPVGNLILAATDKAVVALVWEKDGLGRLDLQPEKAGASCPMLEEAEKQLGEYFRGARDRFDLPFELKGTEFQMRVWNELRKIPFGETWSYRELAERVGNPGAVRAVGSANGRNPVSIFIPCHRVVRTGGELGGYGGGLENKAFLLDLENGRKPKPAGGKR
ncbi:MAG TPA: methylated-DNA--[protein]-cysteine S-methyltransferase [Fibrobacteria bacterium]|nr:methylated-DNA--[protein]-cysteine S-methyltransferase [Fibrobacteria bacterium]